MVLSGAGMAKSLHARRTQRRRLSPMPEDRRLTISTSSRLSPRRGRPPHLRHAARRGFDPAEVRAFLEHVARELQAAPTGSRSCAGRWPRPSTGPPTPCSTRPPSPPPSGQETARVLRSAHEAAAELVARAEADAARLRAQAQDEAEQLQRRTEQSAADRIGPGRGRRLRAAPARPGGGGLQARGGQARGRGPRGPGPGRVPGHGARGPGAAGPGPGRPDPPPPGAAQPDRAAPRRARAPGRDDRRRPPRRRPHHRRALPGRGRSPPGGRGGRSPGRAGELADGALEATSDADGAGDASPSGEPDTRQSVEELFARLRAETAAGPPRRPRSTVSASPSRGTGSGGPAPRSGPVVPAVDEPLERRPARGPSPGRLTGIAIGAPRSGPKPAPDKAGRGPASAHRAVRRAPTRDATAPSGAPGTAGSAIADAGDGAPDGTPSECGRWRRPGCRPPRGRSATRCSIPSSPPWPAGSSGLSRTTRTTSSTGCGPRVVGPGVLPSEDDHAGRYVHAALDQLMDAARAGRHLRRRQGRRRPGGGRRGRRAGGGDRAPLRRRLDGRDRRSTPATSAPWSSTSVPPFGSGRAPASNVWPATRPLVAFSRAALAAVPPGTVVALGRRRRRGRVPRLRRQRTGGTGPVAARTSPPGTRTRRPTPGAAACSFLRTPRLPPRAHPAGSVPSAASRRATGDVVARRRRHRPDRHPGVPADLGHLLHRLPLVLLGPSQRGVATTCSW